MASNNGHAQTVSPETDTPYSTPIFRPASTRRTPSFSSSSPSHDSSFGSSISLNEEFSSPSPINTPPPKFSGRVPFSWEQLPGIPKQLSPKKKDISVATSLLPLPPAGNSNPSKKQIQEEISPKKYMASESFRKDPFFAALVECSKDDHDQTVGLNLWKRSKISRTLSDRFGFINMYSSCKRTSAVSETIVYLPRSTPHYLLNRRPS